MLDLVIDGSEKDGPPNPLSLVVRDQVQGFLAQAELQRQHGHSPQLVEKYLSEKRAALTEAIDRANANELAELRENQAKYNDAIRKQEASKSGADQFADAQKVRKISGMGDDELTKLANDYIGGSVNLSAPELDELSVQLKGKPGHAMLRTTMAERHYDDPYMAGPGRLLSAHVQRLEGLASGQFYDPWSGTLFDVRNLL